MFYVYKVIKGNRVLKGSYTDESKAKQQAQSVKGLVMKDGTIWYDYTAH